MNATAQEVLSVRKFSIDGATEWMEYSGVALADVLNEDDLPAAKLGAVGFSRAPEGASSSFEFAYDEVLVVTKGRIGISSQGKTFDAEAGEVIYLPAGVPGTFTARSDAEFVYVASPPYGAVNRQAKRALLERT